MLLLKHHETTVRLLCSRWLHVRIAVVAGLREAMNKNLF